MQLTDEHKKEIERSVMECIISALDQKLISSDDLPELSNYILPKIEPIRTQEEMLVFLNELVAKWKFFTPVLSAEKGEINSQTEGEAVDKVTELAKSGQIDEAVNLAKSVTDDNQTTENSDQTVNNDLAK